MRRSLFQDFVKKSLIDSKKFGEMLIKVRWIFRIPYICRKDNQNPYHFLPRIEKFVTLMFSLTSRGNSKCCDWWEDWGKNKRELVNLQKR